MKEDHAAAFKEEAYELLADLESALLELEEQPEDMETIGRAFRALHTIKGSGAMFGFDEIASFTHRLEEAFDLVREGKIPATRELISLTLSSGDHIRLLLDSSGSDQASQQIHGGKILFLLDKLISELSVSAPDLPRDRSQADGDTAPNSSNAEQTETGPVTYRIRFRPAQNILVTGTNPLLLLEELHELGPCTITAQTRLIPPLDEIDPEACYTFWDIVITTDRGIDALKDVFIFVEDQCELSIEIIDQAEEISGLAESGSSGTYKKLGQILVERGDLRPDAIDGALRLQKPIGQLLVEAGAVEPGMVESAVAEQQHLKKVARDRSANESSSSIRVPAEKLDKLVNLVGELVTVQARLSQSAGLKGDLEFLSIAEEVERLSVELRDTTMNIRMVPIGTTFSKFKRLVHDLSAELGKQAVIVTEGAETELDKTVIEHLNEPLVHMIRNSIDHGIELPEERIAAGKPAQGVVHLSAVHSGAHVLIQIRDDGTGLDIEDIRTKAIAKGMISPDAEVSEKDLFNLIFAPGFSTAREVTSVSGRGVGMDVVKRRIEALRGTIEVSSRKGSGTSFTLKIPLTLAIIDGLLVQIGESYFVLPLSIVEECVELTREAATSTNGRNIIGLRGEIVPFIRLRDRFGINGTIPRIEQVVVTESANGRIGFVVDNVIGEHQTVIKNLSRVYRNIQGVSGATIMGDGTIALVLDAAKLIQEVEAEEQLD